MAAARGFDAQLAEVEALRELAPAAAEPGLRKALGNRNNLIVAKAAKLTALKDLRALTEPMAKAFPRFVDPTGKADPQCWAKNAIAEALSGFEYQEPELFLAGLGTIQLEAVWGGYSDTAGTLRGICAMGLVQCRTVANARVLGHLLPLFADKQTSVRVNAARAVEQVGTESAGLLLRLRAELGSDEAEVLGACYTAVLRLEGPSAIAWVAKFLPSPYDEADDTAAEAAIAIAETGTEEAFTLLKQHHALARHPSFRDILLTAIALTRQDAAIDFLLALVKDGSRPAREALEQSAPSPDTLARLKQLA